MSSNPTSVCFVTDATLVCHAICLFREPNSQILEIFVAYAVTKGLDRSLPTWLLFLMARNTILLVCHPLVQQHDTCSYPSWVLGIGQGFSPGIRRKMDASHSIQHTATYGGEIGPICTYLDTLVGNNSVLSTLNVQQETSTLHLHSQTHSLICSVWVS